MKYFIILHLYFPGNMNNHFETVDLSYLEEISGGDVSFQKELIEIFLNQIPEFVSNMQEFHSKNESEFLAKEAHTAKSSVLIFMMHETGNDLKQIQLLAENNQSEEIPELLIKVEQALECAFTELTHFLNGKTVLSELKTGSN